MDPVKAFLVALNCFMFFFLNVCSVWMSSLGDDTIGCELDKKIQLRLDATVECRDLIEKLTLTTPCFLTVFGFIHGVISLIFIYVWATEDENQTQENRQIRDCKFFRFVLCIIGLTLYLWTSVYIYHEVLRFGHEDSLYFNAIQFSVPCNVTYGNNGAVPETCLLRYPMNIKRTLIITPVISIVLAIIYFSQVLSFFMDVVMQNMSNR